MPTLLELQRIARFAAAAGLATLVHLAIAEFLVLTHLVSIVFLANLIAFIPAVVVSYHSQRRVTFRAHGSFPQFMLLAALGFLVNNLALLGLTYSQVPAAQGLMLAALASPVLMYLGCRNVVFSQKKRPTEVGLES